jgi:hypothetical protein
MILTTPGPIAFIVEKIREEFNQTLLDSAVTVAVVGPASVAIVVPVIVSTVTFDAVAIAAAVVV